MRMFSLSLLVSAILCIYEVPCEEYQPSDLNLQNTNMPENQLNFEHKKINELLPTVMVVLLVRNKAHTLPHFLALFERLKYPKDRMGLFIRSDHNEDDSLKIMETWIKKWNTKM